MKHFRSPFRAGPLDEVEHVMLVSSGGGHLTQLLRLRPWWESRERTWVTFDTEETRSRLAGERVVHAFHPTTRNLPNLARNTVVAARAVPRLCPGPGAVDRRRRRRAVLRRCPSAGPANRVCRGLRPHRLATVTGRLCYPMSSLFLVQWPQQRRLYPNARVVGALI